MAGVLRRDGPLIEASWCFHSAIEEETSLSVHLYVKAQRLLAKLYRRFRETEPQLFDFADLDQFCALSDSVLPAVLRQQGVLIVAPQVAARIDAEEELHSSDIKAEIALRAKAISGVETLVELIGNRCTALELSIYLCEVFGKDGTADGEQNFKLHIRRNTDFY